MTQKYPPFGKLISEVQRCLKCDRMCDSARVLSFSSGNLNADVMFIGEAPGRLGADKTQIPFHGDTAGHNFEDLLTFAELARESVFVTNAVLCNPKGEQGNNSTPTEQELANCSIYLQRQIEIIDPAIVVTLGAVALRATRILESHRLELASDVRTANNWFGRTLVPLYHPGQRAMIHRSSANQRSDYQFVSELAKRLNRRRRSPSGRTRSDALAACKYLLAATGEVSYFSLHKLVYLAEYLHVRFTGARLTSAFFIRQKDGPYCADLNIGRLKRSDDSISAIKHGDKLYVRLGKATQRQLLAPDETLDSSLRRTLDEVVSRYSSLSDSDLKRAVYMTAPMRLMLRREKYEKINLYNAPIDFLTARAE